MLDAHTAADASARLPVPHTLPSVPAAPDSEPSAHDALFTAATTLLPVLEAGRALDAAATKNGGDQGAERSRAPRPPWTSKRCSAAPTPEVTMEFKQDEERFENRVDAGRIDGSLGRGH